MTARREWDVRVKREWVVGFQFDDDARQVVLVRKNRPEWQAGRLNGVGGKVEPSDITAVATERRGSLLDGDSADVVTAVLRHAMVREFEEETGAPTKPDDWHHFADLVWEEGIVHFLRSFSTLNLERVHTVTDEAIETWDVPAIGYVGDGSITPNLRWLVPLAAHRHDTYDFIDVVETGTTMRKPGRLGVLPGSPLQPEPVEPVRYHTHNPDAECTDTCPSYLLTRADQALRDA